MDLGLSDEQHQLVDSFTNLLAKASTPEHVRAAEPGGVDQALWRTLRETGAVTMGVAEAHGGWGATLVDLALVAERLGRAVAPAPVIEAQVAARLLAAIASPAALDALGPVLAGERLVTLAVRPPQGGMAALTPAGAVCDAVIVLDGDRLLLVPVSDRTRRPVANLAAAPLADIDLSPSAIEGAAATELAAGVEAVDRFEAALDEWLTLTAAALVGIGSAALDLGCAYAAERTAFGAPIGTFQGVSHPLADDATHLDGARLLAQKAAWSLDRDDARGRELAAMAFAFASRTAEAATYDAIHVHGGYGFMLEYDVQLHHRRARGWARVWGDAEAADARAADARYAGARHTTTGAR
ncbi:MAG TPA: acyl-CoA dehydrogenase family protein [Acidimicrobiales bacterium]|nr:acyl-CoA dehydrogenase family protein [Acidimicrobiales bacterium]